MKPANPDDDSYVFWYRTPAPVSGQAYLALLSGWMQAGLVPRQGTPLLVARRTQGAAVEVKEHPPPRTAEDAQKILGGYEEGTRFPWVEGQVDLYLAGAQVRARVHFEYSGEDELSPPRVDPRRPFMAGILFLPQYWRERAKGYEDGDSSAAAAAAEDALCEKYLKALAESTHPLAGLSGPEHDNVRWRFLESDLGRAIPPRLSDLSRYATYLSKDQVAAIGAEHFERLINVFEWVTAQEPRLRPYCRITGNGGALMARWPGGLDSEPKFVSLLPPRDKQSFNLVRAALTGRGAH